MYIYNVVYRTCITAVVYYCIFQCSLLTFIPGIYIYKQKI